jgi:hypothetical protein
MRNWFNVKTIAALSTSALLVACGGGSGGGGSNGSNGPVKSTETFQLKTAYNNYLLGSGSQSYTASVTGPGQYSNGGSGVMTRSTLSSSTWEGSFAYKKSTTNVGASSEGPINYTQYEYVDTNYNPLGTTNPDEYIDVTSYNQIPVTAKVDYSAVWYVANRYKNALKTTQYGTRTTTVTLEPDTASTAILAITLTDKDVVGKTVQVETDRYRITPAGLLTPINVTGTSYLDQGVQTVKITYQ